MTIKELKDLLDNFDDDEEVIISDSSRYGNVYAYEVRAVNKANFTPYYSDDDDEYGVVRIQLGSQVGVVE